MPRKCYSFTASESDEVTRLNWQLNFLTVRRITPVNAAARDPSRDEGEAGPQRRPIV